MDTAAATALEALLAGNARFAVGASHHQGELEHSRVATVERQRPCAMVLGCADSRVVPEFVFDQGIGELFVVRVAANIPTTEALGTFEFAFEQFAPPLLIVLGHLGCGAIQAAAAALDHGQRPAVNLAVVVEALRPALAAVAPDSSDRLVAAMRVNVRAGIAALTARSPVLAAAVAAERLAIVGAEYAAANGRVSLL